VCGLKQLAHVARRLIGVLARDEACLSCFRTGPLGYEQGGRKYSTIERVENQEPHREAFAEAGPQIA